MRVFGLARLSARERYVIGLLREADPARAPGELSDLFDRLRIAIPKIGYRQGPSDSKFATTHELCLLGALAGLQREQVDLGIRLDPRLHRHAIDCARVLIREGIVLRHAAFVRLSGLPEACGELSINLTAAPRRSPHRSTIKLPTPGTIQARALHFVQGRGATSTRDFCDYGISRQIVSVMHKRGVLERVRFGLYRAAPETMRG